MSPAQRPPNHLLQVLPMAEFEALRPRLKRVDMARDAVLAEAGVALTQVYLPHAGIISIVVSLSEGQMIEIATIGRDSLLGAAESLGDGVPLTNAVVLFPGAASTIDIAEFRMIADQSPTLRNLLARHEQALLVQAQQSAACNAAHAVKARLARRLLRAHDLADGETLPMTQEFLARMIGVQRNAISIVALALREAGIIRYSRGQIQITNMEALRRTTCECYPAVRAWHERLLGLPP
jgi:CRP-like cAMP-binding protein